MTRQLIPPTRLNPRKPFRLNLAGLIAAFVLLAGCATSTPVGEWRDPGFSGRLDNILIIGVTERDDRRRAFEDSFVNALAASGVSAVASYRLIESAADLTRDVVEQVIEGRGYGAVLVTRLVGVEQQEIRRLPTTGRLYRDFGGYYDQVSQQNNAGYYSRFQVFSLESNLYETVNAQLVWSMQSEVLDSTKPQQMIDAQIRATIRNLARQDLLGR